MDSVVPPQYFFVTQQPWRGFVGLYTLTQIRELIASGGLTLSHYVSEADGRSFAQFANERGDVRWMTIEQALVHYLEQDKTNINIPSGSYSDNQGKFILLASLVNAELLKAGTFPLPPGTMAHPDVFGAVMSAMTLSEFSDCKEPGGNTFEPQLVRGVVQAATNVAKKNGWQSNLTTSGQLIETKNEDFSNTTDFSNDIKILISNQNTNSDEFLIPSYKNTWWYKSRIGFMLFLFGILVLFANYKLIGGLIFLLGLNILLVGNYKRSKKNKETSGVISVAALMLFTANCLIFFSVFAPFNSTEFLNKPLWKEEHQSIPKSQPEIKGFSIAHLSKEQKTDLNRAISLMEKCQTLSMRGEFTNATPFCIDALEIQRKVLGNNHLQTAFTLNSLAMLYSMQAQYSKAEPLFVESLNIKKGVLGDNHSDTIESIKHLAQFRSEHIQSLEERTLTAEQYSKLEYSNKLNAMADEWINKAQYTKVEPLLIEALKIRREVLGDKHANTVGAINSLGSLYFAKAEYTKAEPLFLEALKINRETLGDKHPDTAQSINNLATIYKEQLEYTKVEPLLIEALKIRREVLGDKHPDTAISINNLSMLYHKQSLYAKAEPLYLEALKIKREIFGHNHPNNTTVINNLAQLYNEQAQYAKAELLYLEVLKNRREFLGNKQPEFIVTSLAGLASLYRTQGQYTKAEPLYLEVYKLCKENEGDKHRNTVASLNNLGFFYFEQAQYAKAEPLFLEALKIRREVLGNKHPDTALSINSLGAFYGSQGQYSKAEPLLVEALKIYKEVLGDNHSETAFTISNLAQLYFFQDLYSKAEPLYLEALKIRRKILGDNHPNTADSISNLALNYSAQAQHAKAEPLCAEALKISTEHLQSTAIIQSENAQILMANKNKRYLSRFLYNAGVGHTLGGGYDQVLSWKGMIYRRQNLLRALQGNDPLKKELSDAIRQLATLLNSTPKPGESKVFQNKVKALSKKKEELEKELAKLIPSLNFAKVTPSDLQNLIAPDAALVDIFDYGGDYAAWVIRKDKPIVRLEIGSAEDINHLVFQWRSSLFTRKFPSEGLQDPALSLREKVWLPIAKHLEDAKTVIISPDGLLGTLPFTALPGEDIKKYLIEERNIAVIPFLQTLPDLLTKKESTGIASMLALGDVAYDVEATNQTNTSGLLAVRGEKGAKWNRLPGTKAEVLSIENSFRKYFPSGSLVELNQNKASEQSVRESAPKSKYLHFATHGFFADETVKAMSVKQDDRKKMMGEKVVVTGENPGLLSGLVLAGANLPPKGNGDDGILTASEVAELDLTGVELAILSACETGLGKTAGGEGIFGLQRAFQLAGARTVVASSWKVPDLSTKELMVRFYGNLWEKKMGKLEALREAQLWVMKEGKAAGLDRGIDDESVVVKETKKEPVKVEGSTKGEMLPPIYWAAWILSGAWKESNSEKKPTGMATKSEGTGVVMPVVRDLLVLPFSEVKAKEKQKEIAKNLQKEVEEKVDLAKEINLEMVLIPAGKFKMGEPGEDHEVTLTKPFYIGKYEVTQEQWEALMGKSPSSKIKGAKLPVTDVSWEDCQEFIKKLNAKTNGVYRLPTEAEWEYACRAGTATRYPFGEEVTPSDANFVGSKIGKPVEVGMYKPNAFGLYDMYGNVWEWCEDWYGIYLISAVVDPKGPATGTVRVLRGGSFDGIHGSAFGSSGRGGGSGRANRHGFRLARMADIKAVAAPLVPKSDPAKLKQEESNFTSTEKEMVLIPAGKFKMGSPATEKGRSNNETPHEVTITKPFYIGKYEVTQEQWEAVMGDNPSLEKGAKRPVTNISWEECQEFIKKLNAKTSGGYRLPTEAEWEFSCRAGTSTMYSFGDKITPKDANYFDSMIGKPVAVGVYKPNAFGLNDMHGNVWEWCEDRYGEYSADVVTDPKGPEAGNMRVLRGGSFLYNASLARSSSRGNETPTLKFVNLGFRLARTP